MATARTSLKEVLQAIKTRLVAKSVLPADRIFFSMKMNPPVHDQADQYITLLPLHQRAYLPTTDGAGRYATEVHGRINVYLRVRLGLDETYRDTEWMTNTLGALDTYHKILGALQMFIPLNGDGDTILMEPMRFLFSGEPKKEKADNFFGEVMLEFEVNYLLNLDISVDV